MTFERVGHEYNKSIVMSDPIFFDLVDLSVALMD